MMISADYSLKKTLPQQTFDLLYDLHDLACIFSFSRPKWTPFRERLAQEIRRIEQQNDALDGIVSVLRQGVGLTANDLVAMGFYWKKPSNVWWQLRAQGYDLVAFRTGKRQRRYYLREHAPNDLSGRRRV
jgi:hypothetical protein